MSDAAVAAAAKPRSHSATFCELAGLAVGVAVLAVAALAALSVDDGPVVCVERAVLADLCLVVIATPVLYLVLTRLYAHRGAVLALALAVGGAYYLRGTTARGTEALRERLRDLVWEYSVRAANFVRP